MTYQKTCAAVQQHPDSAAPAPATPAGVLDPKVGFSVKLTKFYLPVKAEEDPHDEANRLHYLHQNLLISLKLFHRRERLLEQNQQRFLRDKKRDRRTLGGIRVKTKGDTFSVRLSCFAFVVPLAVAFVIRS